MTVREVAALPSVSQVEQIGPDQEDRLISISRFGRRDVRLAIPRSIARSAEVELGKRVTGQDHAIRAVGQALRAAASGVDPTSSPDGARRKPLFSFIFAGATGVGKTELAKAVAEMIFSDERALVRFDMSEYQQDHQVARLIGSPPGYIGHDAGGQLTRAVAGRPSVVLLFDEIEKAHPRILDLFIQVIDDGRLTDGGGHTVDFTSSGIIFTTNLGAEPLYARMGEGHELSYAEVRSTVLTTIEGSLRPELLGRLPRGIVVFDVLRRDAVAGIVAKSLGSSASQCYAPGRYHDRAPAGSHRRRRRADSNRRGQRSRPCCLANRRPGYRGSGG